MASQGLRASVRTAARLLRPAVGDRCRGRLPTRRSHLTTLCHRLQHRAGLRGVAAASLSRPALAMPSRSACVLGRSAPCTPMCRERLVSAAWPMQRVVCLLLEPRGAGALVASALLPGRRQRRGLPALHEPVWLHVRARGVRLARLCLRPPASAEALGLPQSTSLRPWSLLQPHSPRPLQPHSPRALNAWRCCWQPTCSCCGQPTPASSSELPVARPREVAPSRSTPWPATPSSEASRKPLHPDLFSDPD